MKRGVEVSYIDYYKEHYSIEIKDKKQPLLVILPSKKDEKAGKKDPIFIIPELCSVTGNGLLDQYKKDFAMKKELDAITKLNPEVRYSRIRRLLDQFKGNQVVQKDLENWQIEFSDDVVKLPATVLAPISVCFADQVVVSNTERGWDKMMRSSPHIRAIELRDWILIFTYRDEQKAYTFVDELISVAGPMNFKVEKPQM